MLVRGPRNLRHWQGWSVKVAGKLGCRKKFELVLKTLLRITRGRELQIVGAATAKLREPKHVQTWGTNNSLESDQSTRWRYQYMY